MLSSDTCLCKIDEKFLSRLRRLGMIGVEVSNECLDLDVSSMPVSNLCVYSIM